MVKEPVTAWPETRSFSSHDITQSFHKFSSSRTVNRRSPSVASRTRSMFFGFVVSEGRPERGSLSTDVRPFLNRLYHSYICVMPILSSTKTFCIISIVSVQLLPRLKQNLMQIRWFGLYVIFNCKQMRRTEKARWTKTHAAGDQRHPADNYGIQGVREGLLVTLIPRRGQSSALARRYKRRSDTFRIHLVFTKTASTQFHLTISPRNKKISTKFKKGFEGWKWYFQMP